MKSTKWFSGILATAMALSLAGADLALAQCGGGVCTPGAGRGQGACAVQAGQSSGACTNYQKGQGRKKGPGRKQCRRGSNYPVTPGTTAPAAQPAPTPSN